MHTTTTDDTQATDSDAPEESNPPPPERLQIQPKFAQMDVNTKEELWAQPEMQVMYTVLYVTIVFTKIV